MWIEELNLYNVKCFDSQKIKLGKDDKAFPWVTFLGENGTGKSTVLQAIGLLLAGPQAANKLMVPEGWLGNSEKLGELNCIIHADPVDLKTKSNGTNTKNEFSYSLKVTGNTATKIGGQTYSSPSFATESTDTLDWLQENVFLVTAKTWFAAGYGAFRRLSRQNDSRTLVPSLQSPMRYTNFLSQFNEDEALEGIETWVVYLDYLISKSNDKTAKRQFDLGVKAIDAVLPEGYSFKELDENGRMLFQTPESAVSIVRLSDGLRSVLALVGDLIWRMIEAYPDSKKPLDQPGIVLIDELDIHLHPSWQREIPGLLRKTFPNIQFIVATHSPIIAAGAGSDAKTYRFFKAGGDNQVEEISDIYAKSVDDILKSDAFGLVSEFSPETQGQIDQYFKLKNKKQLTAEEQKTLEKSIPFVRRALGPGGEPSPLDLKIAEILNSAKG